MINVEDVKAALSVPAVLQWYGVDYTDSAEIRLVDCPRCLARVKREGCAVNRDTGRWVHHNGPVGAESPCRGDLLELVCAFEQLDRRRDFRKLVERAAAIAGICESTDGAELTAIRKRHEREREHRAREVAERRAVATARLPGRWASLARRSQAGEVYLAGRGLDPAELAHAGCVRFDRNGNVALPLHAYDGSLINIAKRVIDPDAERKRLVARFCGTDGTLVGKIDDIDTAGEGPDVAILTEGITDTLAALFAFPGCVVLGANGASRMEDVAAAIAPRLVAARGWLLVVPDVDGGTGEDNAAEAVVAAERAGLKLDASILLVDVRPHKDLADAVQAGWRWRWPS